MNHRLHIRRCWLADPLRTLLGRLVCLACGLALLCGGHASAHAPSLSDTSTEPDPPVDLRDVERTQPDAMRPDASGPAISEQIELSPVVRRLIDDALTGEAERRRMRLFHGQWDRVESPTPAEAARLALWRGRWDDEALQNEAADVRVRAEARIHAGEHGAALSLLVDAPDDSARAALWRARALDGLGRFGDAVAALEPWRKRLQFESLEDAAELTAAAEAIVLLAHLQGRPSQDYHLALSMLTRARQDLDPLYWPAYLAEGRLLADKDNREQAVEAFLEALTLNPKAGEAWYELGRLAVEGFNFDAAADATDKLREIDPAHPLAALLEAQNMLQQRDTASAHRALDGLLEAYPRQRLGLALRAAGHALAYDEQAVEQTLAVIDSLAPAHPLGPFTVGKALSYARQYEAGREMLEQAIERQPNWPTPHVELGLLLMQAGEPEAARAALTRATRLDPFNRRATNQLRLVEQMLGFETIETERFLIRYRAGVDEVLARLMAEELDEIYADVTAAFSHEPARLTQIELMPDEDHFGVRITGMPDIWTIAACTGDVIAMAPPRSGPKQRGAYNWANVVRHEFVHTVTLDQTRNRVPHWFTEACAVSQELVRRSEPTCRLLAWALHEDELFPLDQINWGFVRPKTPRDRPLAYAQADWMLEFIDVRFGRDAIVDMLGLHREGVAGDEALQRVTELSAERFMSEFKAWATEQVEAWGLAPRPGDAEVESWRSTPSERREPAALDRLAEAFPDHPDVIRLLGERAMANGDAAEARRLAERYAELRPIDPWPHRVIAKLALEAGDEAEAIAALERLDEQDVDQDQWARELARLHRAGGRLDEAAAAVRRALWRRPYDPSLHELAATIELQRGEAPAAVAHLEANALLEPDRAVHLVRLAALHHRVGDPEAADAAARRALELDDGAPVERFFLDRDASPDSTNETGVTR